jgi:SnoaL-like domain
MRVTDAFARTFAQSWYAAWNAHDVDAIMSHYAPTIEHSSPFIKRYNNSDDPSIVGVEGVEDYFARALQRNPTLRFDPMHLTVGLESLVLIYKRMTGDLAAEMFVFDDQGNVIRSISHYHLT